MIVIQKLITLIKLLLRTFEIEKGTLIGGSEISLNIMEAEPVQFAFMVNCVNKVGDLFIYRDDLTSYEKPKVIKVIIDYDIKMTENNPVSYPARRLPYS